MDGDTVYIALDGIDGSGKNRQAGMLLDALTARGEAVLFEREPDDDNETGALLRRWLATGAHSSAHAALFLADRLESQPSRMHALARGIRIVQVRSYLSTIVYQRARWPESYLWDIHRGMGAYPDLIVVLDVPVDEALRRCAARGTDAECYERADVLTEARAAYRRMVGRHAWTTSDGADVSTRVVMVDGTGTWDEVHSRVMGAAGLGA